LAAGRRAGSARPRKPTPGGRGRARGARRPAGSPETLQPRQAWTVEPGIYVVPALLARERGRDGVDWDRVDELHGFGGVRLEQNLLITDEGCEILTAAVPL
jgi:Xaa-Pro aminopeptidase